MAPWNNDWEPMRLVMGEPPVQPITGYWEISQNTPYRDSRPYPFDIALSGYLGFQKDGSMRLEFQRGRDYLSANGFFVQAGDKLFFRNLQSDPGMPQLPPLIEIDLAWRDGNTVVASVEKREDLYLNRLDHSPF
ncbi:MAG: hypothetical protein JSS72_06110 [Armatimonadetes bacterium]|nr:hypothetical protein [Armatimonadota bacterium]